MAGIPSFWVNSAACIDSEENKILHKMAHGEMRETNCWLPDGPVTIGITSGASTPDRDVEYVLDKVFRIRDPKFQGEWLLMPDRGIRCHRLLVIPAVCAECWAGSSSYLTGEVVKTAITCGPGGASFEH